MGFKTRPKDRNKTIGHGKKQPVRGDDQPATSKDLQRLSRGQGDTAKAEAKAAKRRRGKT